ncbi:MAG: pectinesterase family protein [Lachnospiraceae bacterium]|nr:pectinesterase family protein [Lachnospiraceae bacterium]
MKEIRRKSLKVLLLSVIMMVLFVLPIYGETGADNVKKSDKQKNTIERDSTKSTASIPSNVPSPQQAYKKGIYNVALDGTGDFTSIAAAVAQVPSGSTLIIHEGIYNEALNIQTKQINMKGVSKERCIIQYDTANYSFVPLNIASGTYDNLTINGYHKAKQKGAFPGYAIHIDCDSLTGQAVIFNNCNIISENAFCVGIGLRKGAKIAFRGCNFVAKKQGVMLFHDSQTPSLAGSASIDVENCVMNNYTDGLIITQCISPASTTNLTFRNNTVIGNGDGFCLAYGSYGGSGTGWMGAQNVVLTSRSAGNNIMSFNYAEMAKYRDSINATSVANSAQIAASAANVAPNGKKKVNKFYTIIDEQGREVNVPAENIDGVIFYEDGTYEPVPKNN